MDDGMVKKVRRKSRDPLITPLKRGEVRRHYKIRVWDIIQSTKMTLLVPRLDLHHRHEWRLKGEIGI